MTDPVTASLFSLSAGIIPILMGVLLIFMVRGWEPSKRGRLSALVIGVLLVSFFDLLKGTAGLSGSTLRSLIDAANVSFFAVALLGFLLIHRSLRNEGGMALAYLWAVLGIGLHSLGEGIVIGYDFATGLTNLSLPQVLSFTLHKIAEGASIGVLLYSTRVGLTHSVAVSLTAGLPVGLGTILGLIGLPGGVSTIFFAASAGATVYALTSIYATEHSGIKSYAAWVLLGFLYMYFAGVLHQFE